jgi:hypothetical protein
VRVEVCEGREEGGEEDWKRRGKEWEKRMRLVNIVHNMIQVYLKYSQVAIHKPSPIVKH